MLVTNIPWKVDIMEEFDEIIQLYYYADDNVFMDEDGFPVFGLFHIIAPNDLFLFKVHKEYMLVPHRENPKIGVELFYPDDDWKENNYD